MFAGEKPLTKTAKVRRGINLDKDLFDALRKIQIERMTSTNSDVSLSSVVNEAIRNGLKEMSPIHE
jgi:hypothetical protein